MPALLTRSSTSRLAAVSASVLLISGAAFATATDASQRGAAPSSVKVLAPESPASDIRYRTIEVNGQSIFYREAGDRSRPTVLLLHGFPTSSHMFRELIPQLATDYHVIAPDYPGYGNSSEPSPNEFEYTFANLAVVITGFIDAVELDTYSLYVMDYGAPIGFRIAAASPERVNALIIQNGNAYEEGLREFWDPIKAYWTEGTKEHRNALRSLLTVEATEWQYTHGVRNTEAISPDTWLYDQAKLDRPGNNEIQLDLFYDYRTNVPLYAAWQRYFRESQPNTLIVWGKNDYIFPIEGAYPYLKDLPNAELHVLDTGHFALEEDGDYIAKTVRDFLSRHVD